MRRFLIGVLVAVMSTGIAVADDVFGGWIKLSPISSLKKDGRRARSIMVPYWVRPVGETKRKIEKMYGREIDPYNGPDSLLDTLVTIYKNDNVDNYFGGNAEGPMSTALDDVRITGAGVQTGILDRITMGWQIPDRGSVFFVMGFYDTELGNTGPGQSMFSNIIVDSFGGPFNASNTTAFPVVPGEYMITFGSTISQMGIQFQDDQVYFFQQFHQSTWNGPFNDDWAMFYSGNTGPQIGASDDSFVYDFDPQDAIYASNEVDNFGGTPYEANFALQLDIESNSTFTDLPAVTVANVRGGAVSGNFLSTWSSNNAYYVSNNINKNFEHVWPNAVIATTSAPSTAPISLQVTLESKTSVTDSTVRVSAYNYWLGVWERFGTYPIGNIDSTHNIVLTGNASRFVDPGTLDMKVLLEYKNPASSWTSSIDWIRWRFAE